MTSRATDPTGIFEHLRKSIRRLETVSQLERVGHVDPAIMRERTQRIAREPMATEPSTGMLSCIVFERACKRYAVRLDALDEVASAGPLTLLPGVREIYRGLASHRGRVIAVLDIPCLFNSEQRLEFDPEWLLITHGWGCGLAADRVDDIIDFDIQSTSGPMPTFPALVQRYTAGVLEDRTVVLDIATLLADPALRVEARS